MISWIDVTYLGKLKFIDNVYVEHYVLDIANGRTEKVICREKGETDMKIMSRRIAVCTLVFILVAIQSLSGVFALEANSQHLHSKDIPNQIQQGGSGTSDLIRPSEGPASEHAKPWDKPPQNGSINNSESGSGSFDQVRPSGDGNKPSTEPTPPPADGLPTIPPAGTPVDNGMLVTPNGIDTKILTEELGTEACMCIFETTPCSETVQSGFCPLCQNDFTKCMVGKCVCTDTCVIDCIACLKDPTVCEAPPLCICMFSVLMDLGKCTEEITEVGCLACQEDIKLCTGVMEKVCTCSYMCTENTVADKKVSCNVCRNDYSKCISTNPLPPCECTIDTGCIPACKKCEMEPSKCNAICICKASIYKCYKYEINKDCPVCGTGGKGIEHCEGLIEIIHTCEGLNAMIQDPSASDDIQILGDIDMDQTIEIRDRNIKVYYEPTQEMLMPIFARNVEHNQKPLFVIGEGGHLTIENIYLDGSSDILNSSAPLILVEEGGKLTIGEGASLRNNENLADNSAGGIVVNGGTLEIIENANIANNKAAVGGAVLLQNGGKLYMNGTASIMNNTAAKDGGGVFVGEDCTLTIGDRASIVGNYAGGKAAGIYIAEGANVSMSGSPKIYTNTAGNRESNVLLARTAGDIQINEGFAAGAKIGITLSEKEGGMGSFAVKDSAFTSSDAKAFFSDGENKFVAQSGNQLVLTGSTPVSGIILKDGRPTAGVQVTLWDCSDGEILCKTTTDGSGNYYVPMTMEGVEYQIEASASVGRMPFAGVEKMKVTTVNGKQSFAQVSLKPGVLVQSDLTGTGDFEGAKVTIKDLNGQVTATTEALIKSYSIILQENGTYFVTAETQKGENFSGNGIIELSRETAKADAIVMRQGKLGSGRVETQSGSGAVGAVLEFVPAALKTRLTIKAYSPNAQMAVTNNKGQYEISGLQEGTDYSTMAILKPTGEGEKADSGYNLATVQLKNGEVNVAGGNNIIQLRQGDSFEGTFGYTVKPDYGYGYPIGEEFPENLKVELRTASGTTVAETSIDPNTGRFKFDLIFEGNYRLAVVSGDDQGTEIRSPGVDAVLERVPEGMEELRGQKFILATPDISYLGTAFFSAEVDGNGKPLLKLLPTMNVHWFRLNILDLQNMEMNKNLDLEQLDTVILIKMTADNLNRCNSIERDMIPKAEITYLNELMNKLAARYKVAVKTPDVEADMGISAVGSSLGVGGFEEGSGVNDSARRIAGSFAANRELPEATQITLRLNVGQGNEGDKKLIDEALKSGSVLKYFDVTLQADAKLPNNGGNSRSLISEPAEPIKVSIDLEDFAYEPDCEYTLLRVHTDANGKKQISELSVSAEQLKNKKIEFTSDKFSVYALAVARPGEGIVIEQSKPNGGGASGGGLIKPEEKPDVPAIDDEKVAVAEAEQKSEEESVAKTSANMYNFWLSVRERLRTAPDGACIQIDAGSYDLIPNMVIEALAGKNIVLTISSDNGQSINLYGKRITADSSKSYYDLSSLAAFSENMDGLTKELESNKIETVKKEEENIKDENIKEQDVMSMISEDMKTPKGKKGDGESAKSALTGQESNLPIAVGAVGIALGSAGILVFRRLRKAS